MSSSVHSPPDHVEESLPLPGVAILILYAIWMTPRVRHMDIGAVHKVCHAPRGGGV